MAGVLSPSAQKIQDLLNDLGHPVHVLSFATSTRTAAEAASVIGCRVDQIAKSILFRTRDSNRSVLVIASGPNRVNEALVARRLVDRIGGERLLKAEPEFVRSQTGYPIGGVPPLGHSHPPAAILFDESLLAHDLVWAAAGTTNSVFPLPPVALQKLVGGVVGPVA